MGGEYLETNRFRENGRRIPDGSRRILSIHVPITLTYSIPLSSRVFAVSSVGVVPDYWEYGVALYPDKTSTRRRVNVSAQGTWGVGVYPSERFRLSTSVLPSVGFPLFGETTPADGSPYPSKSTLFSGGVMVTGEAQLGRLLLRLSGHYLRPNELIVEEAGRSNYGNFRYMQSVRLGIETGFR